MLGFKGRNAQKIAQIASAPSSVAVMSALPVHYGGKSTSNVSPSIPKISQVLAKGAVPSTAFTGGSAVQLEFPISRTCGKLVDTLAKFDIALSTTDGDGADIVICPSAFFCQRVEILCDGQIFETIEAPELFAEETLWLDDQEFALKRSLYNISSTGGFTSAIVLADEVATSTKTYYLPLNANFLGTIQPFIKGFSCEWSYRLTLATSIVSSVKKTGTNTAGSCVVALTGLKLFTTEQNLGDAGEVAMMSAHTRGAVYKTILRSKFVSSQYSSVPNSADFSVVMTSFNQNDSAGLSCYVRKGTEAISDYLTHYELSTLELRDGSNSQLTISLPAKIVEQNAQRQVPISSAVINNSPTNNYLFPFCSHLHSALETGRFLGGMTLSGTEQFVFRPVSTLTDVKVVIVSYDYATLKVVNGKVSLERKASA